MIKKLLFLAFSLTALTCGYAQAQTVSGKVSAAGDQTPLPGVSVLIKGTTIGTSTDSNGDFTISNPDLGNGTLVFSYIGFATQEISVNNQTVLNVTLQEDVSQLNEVVVTALGITKETQTLGYSVSKVDGSLVSTARDNNVALGLSGRVAGLNVKGTNSGPGGTAKILLRGMPSMNSGGNPLFVINGVPMDNTQRGASGEWGGSDNGDGIGNLNPDDIESMTVLKGQSASALYGSRATNGVILITTKKGKRGDFEIGYNMNYMADKAMNLTDYQYEYGQGQYGLKPTTAAEALGSTRLSWGPRLDGSQVIQFDGNQYPYSAQKDNIKNFYRTGSSLTHTISVSKGGENGSFRLSLSNLDNKSIIENSGIDRKTINLNVEQNITDKLKVTAMANYVDEQSKNRPQLSDGPMNANNGQFLATNIDERILNPGYNTTTGIENRWGDDEYVTNPYFVINKYINEVGRKRLISAVSARYDFTKWLYAQGRIGYDQMNDRVFKVEPWGTAYTNSPQGPFRGNLQELSQASRSEFNADALIGVSKEISQDFSIDGLIGANTRINEWEYERIAGNTFVLPYLYTISNVYTVITNPGDNYKYEKRRVNSAYYSVDFAYKKMLTLSTTGRYDAYSTLASDNNTVFTPSVSTAFIFSELLDMPALSLGKFRASWAKTSGDAAKPYKTQLYYGLGSPLNGVPMGTFETEQPNGFLKPFTLTEIELGFDLKFFQNRLGLDLAWYTRQTKNEIMGTTFSAGSGFQTGFVGTGSTRNTGLEVLITGTPVQTPDFKWNVTFNVTTVKNEILETDPTGANQVQGSNRASLGNAVTSFVKGMSGPQIMAFDYKRNANGDILVTDAGLPIKGDELVAMGQVLPKVFGGITNDFMYKNFTLSFLIDANFGNKILSATEFYSIRRGLNKMTLEGRGEKITKGVNVNTGAVNTFGAEPQDFYRAVAEQITATSVVSGDFIKLRQASLSYNMPSSLFTKVPVIRSVQISLVGRNLAILMRKAKNIDPEASFGSDLKYYGIEGTNLPSTRSYGFNLNVKLK